MTAGASAGAKSTGDAGSDEDSRLVEDRDEMLADLDVAIAEAKRKVKSGRVYDAENEKVRIKWIRALAYAMNVRRQIAQDRDLEALAEKIEALEDNQETNR
jgi:hypothetical protein